jgi:hypothetical protein
MPEKDTKATASAPKAKLLPASESGDVRVHTLLAQVAGAGDDKAALKAIDDELAALGYTRR